MWKIMCGCASDMLPIAPDDGGLGTWFWLASLSNGRERPIPAARREARSEGKRSMEWAGRGRARRCGEGKRERRRRERLLRERLTLLLGDIVPHHAVGQVKVRGRAVRQVRYDHPVGLAPGLVQDDDVGEIVPAAERHHVLDDGAAGKG